MRLRAKLTLAASLLTVVLAACVAVSLWTYGERESATSARAQAGLLQRAVIELNVLSIGFLLHSDDQVRDQWARRHASLLNEIQSAEDGSPVWHDLRTGMASMAATVTQLASLPKRRPETLDLPARRVLANRLLAESQHVAAVLDRYLSAVEGRAAAREQAFVPSLVVPVAVLLGAIVGIGAIVGRDVVVPVLSLHRSARRMAAGDLDTPIESKLRNEIGDIVREIDRTRVRLRDVLASDRRMSERLARQEGALRRQADDLRRSNEDLRQFAYVASHDLRAPLRGLIQLAAWIDEDAGASLPADARDSLAMLRDRADRMDRLLTDLLAYSRAGHAVHEPETVDTRALVEDLVGLAAAPDSFTIDVAPCLPEIETVRAPLEQVLRNLVFNALQHHDREAGRISISARSEAGGYRFSIADDGPGIPPDQHARVFEMCQTLKPKDQMEGTGMGLTLVRRIVEGRGGRVWIDSAAERRGATVLFFWPVDALAGGQERQ